MWKKMNFEDTQSENWSPQADMSLSTRNNVFLCIPIPSQNLLADTVCIVVQVGLYTCMRMVILRGSAGSFREIAREIRRRLWRPSVVANESNSRLNFRSLQWGLTRLPPPGKGRIAVSAELGRSVAQHAYLSFCQGKMQCGTQLETSVCSQEMHSGLLAETSRD